MENSCLVGTAAAIFAVYIATLSPSIAGGDSGELVAEGCSLGLAHPPGYPLFTMMVNLLKRLADPVGIEVAYAVNISSAFLTTAASLLMGKVVLTAGPPGASISGAVLCMGTFAFSPLIWQYAVTAEVFPLNTFFAALLVFLVVEFARHKSERIMALGALLCGVALCNQHTIILYEIPLIIWMLAMNYQKIRNQPSLLLNYACWFFLGMTLYLYLPLAATLVDSPGGWGDLKSMKGIIHHMLRRDYGTFQLYSGNAGKLREGMIERTIAYIEDLTTAQALYVGPILSLLGALYWIRCCGLAQHEPNDSTFGSTSKPYSPNGFMIADTKSNVGKKSPPIDAKKISANKSDIAIYTPTAIAAAQVFYFLVFHSLSNLPLSDKLLYGVHQRFWMQPNVVTFIWIGIGFNAICDSLVFAAESGSFVKTLFNIVSFKSRTGGKNSAKQINLSGAELEKKKKRSFLFYIVLCAAITLVLFQCYRHFSSMDQSDNKLFHNYARALLEPLPRNAVLLVNYDMQWTAIRYMQRCLGLRLDVTAINLSMMTFAWFKNNRHHYPMLRFPGAYYSAGATASGARNGDIPFSMFQFFEANAANKLRDKEFGGIFLCGKLSFPDPNINAQYEIVPYGLTQTFVRRNNSDPLLVPSLFHKTNHDAWKIVTSALATLPDKEKFTEHTWEWTIGRDFTDRVVDVASVLLEKAITIANTDPNPLLDAVFWSEVGITLEKGFIRDDVPTPPTSLLKNAGLGHAHIVQNKLIKEGEKYGEYPIPQSFDVFQTILGPEVDWPTDKKGKEWSADKFVQYWGEFLSRADAKTDVQYETIRKMYKAATKAVKAEPSVPIMRKSGEKGEQQN